MSFSLDEGAQIMASPHAAGRGLQIAGLQLLASDNPQSPRVICVQAGLR
jgi:hypothetical protein